MLIPELCFVEIINQITSEIKQGNYSKVESEKSILSSSLCYSKEYTSKNKYVFEGYIDIDEGCELHYYFSHTKSYISIDKKFEESEIGRYQYCLLVMVEKLFVNYKINLFIDELFNKNKYY
jgi:hypothetical protein